MGSRTGSLFPLSQKKQLNFNYSQRKKKVFKEESEVKKTKRRERVGILHVKAGSSLFLSQLRLCKSKSLLVARIVGAKRQAVCNVTRLV